MVLDKLVYNDINYWEGGITGTKLAWGYTSQNGYLEKFQENITKEGESIAFNGAVREFIDKLVASGSSFENRKVLEIGGAIGYISKVVKGLFSGVTYDVLDIGTYWTVVKPSIESTVDTYFNVDIVTKAEETGGSKFKNNEYDVIFSVLTLECLTDAELAIVIPKLNSWTGTQQIHIFSVPVNLNQPTKDASAYNAKTLAEWALMGFESGTILQDRDNNEVVV